MINIRKLEVELWESFFLPRMSDGTLKRFAYYLLMF